MRSLSDRVAVVTGAAAGIGRATSLAPAHRGCDLALVDLSEEGLAVSADAVRRIGRTASTHRVDVASREAMRTLPDRVLAEHGRVHVLVNNAGVGHSGSFVDSPLEDWEWLLGINFWEVVHGCHFFLPILRSQDEAHIVNLSSMLAFMGLPHQGPYAVSKAAVRSFTGTLAAELSGTGVGVTSVHPGAIATDIVRRSRFVDESQKEPTATRVAKVAIPPERVARRIVRAIERRTPRIRVGPDAVVIEVLKLRLPVATIRASGGAYRRWGRSPERRGLSGEGRALLPYAASSLAHRRFTKDATGRISIPSSVLRALGSRQTTMRPPTRGWSSTRLRRSFRSSRVMRSPDLASIAARMSPRMKSTSIPLASRHYESAASTSR